ncbi:hypothetical protein [Rhodobacter sp. NSM]|uniref:hypothetical protein n=1 Tax=Rhodobacter sp. NSM TaxID=3457501 RepID=UPI003FCF24A9
MIVERVVVTATPAAVIAVTVIAATPAVVIAAAIVSAAPSAVITATIISAAPAMVVSAVVIATATTAVAVAPGVSVGDFHTGLAMSDNYLDGKRGKDPREAGGGEDAYGAARSVGHRFSPLMLTPTTVGLPSW